LEFNDTVDHVVNKEHYRRPPASCRLATGTVRVQTVAERVIDQPQFAHQSSEEFSKREVLKHF